ncbi:MAG: phosphodiester glycosidase family protein, partial [Bacteroidota bacterium]
MPPVVRKPDTATYVSFMLASGVTPIRMYWRDDSGGDLRSFQRIRSYEEQRGKHLRFAMNGGMFQKDHSPVGLFIQNSRVLSPLDTSSGWGNFYLKPNGVFLVRKDHTAAIVTTDHFVYTSDIEFATQSGPMLLIDGAIHPVFEKESEHLNIRNGVGVRGDGTVIFAISRSKVTLYEFASYFKEMGCRNALYLDGFVSRCYLP